MFLMHIKFFTVEKSANCFHVIIYIVNYINVLLLKIQLRNKYKNKQVYLCPFLRKPSDYYGIRFKDDKLFEELSNTVIRKLRLENSFG